MARTCEVPIHDGVVACPFKGGVDVELCYRCPRLRAFFDDESGTKVVCSTPTGIFDGLHALLAGRKPTFRR